MAEDGRTIKVRCATWDQVEAFYTHKLRGNVMVVKMPVSPGVGSAITIALGLPNGLVMAIDGDVSGVGTLTDGKHPVQLSMRGVDQARKRLARLVAEGKGNGSPEPVAASPPPQPVKVVAPRAAPPPIPVEVTPEQKTAMELAATLKQMLQLPAHEVLGVAQDAGETAARAGFLSLTKRYHPDAYGRHRSAEVRRLAEDLFIHVSQAYARMRQAGGQGGWFEEVGGQDRAAPAEDAPVVVEMEADEPPEMSAADVADAAPPADPGAAPPEAIADLLDAGRRALHAGSWSEARERFAAALRLDPRARPIRALYHVANGLELRERGRAPEATLQFETALVHDRACEEAKQALHGGAHQKKGLFRRLFDR
jgi:hypothetical protein